MIKIIIFHINISEIVIMLQSTGMNLYNIEKKIKRNDVSLFEVS